jgi:hypothetical protein
MSLRSVIFMIVLIKIDPLEATLNIQSLEDSKNSPLQFFAIKYKN